ncbi:flagellar M-ring protein FliF C-terminal domain-containing protein [Chitinibacteraceae bacterium HSL-7]
MAFRGGGGGLTVNQGDLERARLKVYAADSALAHEVGLELFSGSDLGMTDFTQHVNLVRALQGELARTISALPGVAAARVHVSIPEMSAATRSRQIQPKAAVTLRLKDGYASLPQERILAVQQLVAAAIPGLKIEEVSVIDERGLPVSGVADGMGRGLGMSRQGLEAHLEAKIRQLLQPMIGAEGVLSVAVAVSYSQIQKRTSRDVPTSSGTFRGVPAGVLQSSRTKHEGLTSSRNADENNGSQSLNNEELVFSSGRSVEQTEEGPDKVIRLTASVVIAKAKYWTDAPTYERIIADGLGIDPARGDRVSVELLPVTLSEQKALPLNDNASQAVGAGNREAEKTTHSSWGYYLGWLTAGGLLLLLSLQSVFRWRAGRAVPELTKVLQEHLRALRGAR